MNLLAIATILAETQLHVDKMPSRNSISFVNEKRELTSSKLINACRLLTHIHNVSILGFIGNDMQGKTALQDLKSYGIDSKLVTSVNERTGTVTIVTDPKTGPAIILEMGANKHLNQADTIVKHMQLKPDYVYLTTAIPHKELKRIIEIFNQRNVKIFIDTEKHAYDMDLDTLRGADFLIPNREEAEAMTGIKLSNTKNIKSAIDLLQTKINGSVVITLDVDGAALLENGQLIQVNTRAIEDGDSTGAGDIMRGVLINELMSGKKLSESVKKAVKLATKSVETIGVNDSVLTIKNLLDG